MAPPAEAPTWRDLVRAARTALGGPDEALVLAEEAAGLSRIELVLALDTSPGPEERARFGELVDRRRRGLPLQHVVGHWGFRRLDLLVDGRALVPRPETEITVEVALAELAARRPAGWPALAVELGTGSGAIACSLATEREGLRVVATDRSPAALEVARLNRARLDADAAGRIELRPGDWYRALEPGIAGKVDLVVANPPYIAASEWRDLDPVVRDFDPREALVAGETGREAIEVILEGAPAWLSRDGAAVVELAPHQVAAAVAFAGACGAVGTQVRRDLSGRDRVLVARW
ncbi:MAG: peptide chain release factor N(5)-glutamine methyltransferase [Acidimicrobiales bacterium]